MDYSDNPHGYRAGQRSARAIEPQWRQFSGGD